MKHSPPAVKRRIQFLLDEYFLGDAKQQSHISGVWVIIPETTDLRLSKPFRGLLFAAAPDGDWDVVMYDKGVYHVWPSS